MAQRGTMESQSAAQLEPFTGPEIAAHLERCPRQLTGLGFGPEFVMVPVALYGKVCAYLNSEART